VGLVLIGGALAFVLGSTPPWMMPATLKEELVKLGLQVVVVGLAGGGVKLLLDRQQEHRKFRSDMLERLGRAHKDVYRIRRLLPKSDDKETLALIGELMNVRQDLGFVYHVVRVWGLDESIQKIQTEIEAMRKYLETVTAGALSPPEAPEHAAYKDFLDWQKDEGRYQEEFKARYRKAKQLVDPSFGGKSELMSDSAPGAATNASMD
jgi:hypothetical protein